MEKGERNLSLEENIGFVKQLVNSLEEAEIKLNKSLKENNSEKFMKVKRFMKQIQARIDEVLQNE
jgi:exonuclease VII small subunit